MNGCCEPVWRHDPLSFLPLRREEKELKVIEDELGLFLPVSVGFSLCGERRVSDSSFLLLDFLFRFSA